MGNLIGALLGWVPVVGVVPVGIWMAVVAIRMIRLPKRNGWQLAWLTLAAILTVYCGSFTLIGLFGLLFAEGEAAAWAGLGFVLYLFLWIFPIAATYVVGQGIAWTARTMRRHGVSKKQQTTMAIAALAAVITVSLAAFLARSDGPILWATRTSAREDGGITSVRLLLWLGADVNARAIGDGTTPLQYAVRLNNGHRELAELLIASGADVNRADAHGTVPIYEVMGHTDSDILRMLIEHGVDVNARRRAGWTPLHEAARLGRPEKAMLLIEAGADVNAKDDAGRTPLDVALASGHPEMARLLRE